MSYSKMSTLPTHFGCGGRAITGLEGGMLGAGATTIFDIDGKKYIYLQMESDGGVGPAGGGVERNETARQAMTRELREEMNWQEQVINLEDAECISAAARKVSSGKGETASFLHVSKVFPARFLARDVVRHGKVYHARKWQSKHNEVPEAFLVPLEDVLAVIRQGGRVKQIRIGNRDYPFSRGQPSIAIFQPQLEALVSRNKVAQITRAVSSLAINQEEKKEPQTTGPWLKWAPVIGNKEERGRVVFGLYHKGSLAVHRSKGGQLSILHGYKDKNNPKLLGHFNADKARLKEGVFLSNCAKKLGFFYLINVETDKDKQRVKKAGAEFVLVSTLMKGNVATDCTQQFINAHGL